MKVNDREFYGERALSLVTDLAAIVRNLAVGTPYEAEAQAIVSKAVRFEVERVNNAMLHDALRETDRKALGS